MGETACNNSTAGKFSEAVFELRDVLILVLPLCVCVCVCELLSCVRLCHPMDCSHQAPPSMGFARQEYWSGVPVPCAKIKYNDNYKQDYKGKGTIFL